MTHLPPFYGSDDDDMNTISVASRYPIIDIGEIEDCGSTQQLTGGSVENQLLNYNNISRFTKKKL